MTGTLSASLIAMFHAYPPMNICWSYMFVELQKLVILVAALAGVYISISSASPGLHRYPQYSELRKSLL